MRLLRTMSLLAAAALIAAGLGAGAQAEPGKAQAEDYIREPMPAGVQVIITELEGPVFANAEGKTLYRWQQKRLHGGLTGDQPNRPSTCGDHVYTESSGYMGFYPAGLKMPNAATRPSCAQMWPPFLAAADAKPLGRWTIIERTGGGKQWAYDGFPAYTSVLDRRPGDVIDGTRMVNNGQGAPLRSPIGPRPNVPPQFKVFQTTVGRRLATSQAFSVYMSDQDGVNKSNCAGACLEEWAPATAPAYARPIGEFTIFERAPGEKQWAFRGHPLYTNVVEQNKPGSFFSSDIPGVEGSDIPGWHNVYTQMAPLPPKAFTVQETRGGQVYADAQGHTIYTYQCDDDAVDQLTCDHPDTEQAYRLAVCGGGDVATCNKAFPYVIAAVNAASGSQLWGTMDIDPATGHRAKPGDTGALHVWTYRDRPIYTFYRDRKPGDLGANRWGEVEGTRNGFKAFWVRNDFE